MSKTVLVVDDSLVSRMMIKAIVDSNTDDVNIIEAGSGDQALSKLDADSKVDIALVDYNMPGMTGLELIAKLADLITIPKVALLTANIQDEIKAEAVKAGVTFLNKPVEENIIANFLNS